MTAYRDDAPGLAARLADLRAAWAVEPLPRREAFDAFVARGARIGGGLAAVAVQGLLLLAIVVLTLAPDLPLARPPLFITGIAGFAAYVVLKLLGRWLGAVAARRRAARLVAGDAAPADPMRAIAWYEQHSRAGVLLVAARRLETRSIGLYMLSGHLFAFQLSVCAVLALGERASRQGEMLLGLLALLVLHGVATVAVLLSVTRGAPRRWLGLVLPIGAAAVIYAMSNPPVLGIGMVFQGLILVIRAWRVHRQVQLERRWLC